MWGKHSPFSFLFYAFSGVASRFFAPFYDRACQYLRSKYIAFCEAKYIAAKQYRACQGISRLRSKPVAFCFLCIRTEKRYKSCGFAIFPLGAIFTYW